MANEKSRRVMEKIGLHHHVTDVFDYPNIIDNSRLRQYLLYRLEREQYLTNMHVIHSKK
jgi:RimJ/RimL family protein N-acetyltransferase